MTKILEKLRNMDANWALVIVTLLLLTVTYLYANQTKKLAKDTKRMADIMVADYENRVRALLQIELRTRTGSGQDIILRNRGNFAIEITDISLIWNFSDSSKLEEFKRPFKVEILYPNDVELRHTVRFSREEFASYNKEKYNNPDRISQILNEISASVRVYFKDARGKEDFKEENIGRLS